MTIDIYLVQTPKNRFYISFGTPDKFIKCSSKPITQTCVTVSPRRNGIAVTKYWGQKPRVFFRRDSEWVRVAETGPDTYMFGAPAPAARKPTKAVAPVAKEEHRVQHNTASVYTDTEMQEEQISTFTMQFLEDLQIQIHNERRKQPLHAVCYTVTAPAANTVSMPLQPCASADAQSCSSESAGDSGDRCCVCMSSHASKLVKFSPCGHAETCAACVSKLHKKQCPICRSHIVSFQITAASNKEAPAAAGTTTFDGFHAAQ
jgi:hypothetical protein